MDFQLNRGMPGMPQMPPHLPNMLLVVGGAVAGFGLLLLWYEWLLRWLVAGVFLAFGGLLLLIGLKSKRLLG